jgi:exodeoxyribonuclease-3
MRVATWNVNSIRTRVGRVVDWLVREDVDVLAMQEIKCKPNQFPFDAFTEAGYEVELHGISQWNGVAFASRIPMEDVSIGFDSAPGFSKLAAEIEAPPKEARAIGVTVQGVRLWSLYVPNGRELNDPHYAYKLQWLANLATETRGWIAENPSQPLALMGDFNIAPLDTDVWDIRLFEGKTHVSQPERDAFCRTPASSTRCARAASRATPTGTTSSCVSRATRVCTSTSSSGHDPSMTSLRAPTSTGTNARGMPRATTFRS